MADSTTTQITPQDIKSSLRIEVTDDDDMIQLQEYINFLLFKKTENEPKKGKV